MRCKRITSLELGSFCGVNTIEAIGIFPNGADDLSIGSLGDKSYLDSLTQLSENAPNKLIIMKGGKFEENEPTSAENKYAEFNSGKKIKVSQTNGGNKFTIINSVSARRTFREIDGAEWKFIYFHKGGYISAIESGDNETLKAITGNFAVVGEYKDEAPIITIDISYSVDYEMYKMGVSTSYDWTDIFSVAGIDFQAVSSSVGSIIFDAYDKSGSLLTDSDLTIGAAGTHMFEFKISGIADPGAVTFTSSTGHFTFTPTAPFTLGDVVTGGYQDVSVTGEEWITSSYLIENIA